MDKCGDCAYLITSDGEPYYCAMRDLYYFCEADDVACEDFVESDSNAHENSEREER